MLIQSDENCTPIVYSCASKITTSVVFFCMNFDHKTLLSFNFAVTLISSLSICSDLWHLFSKHTLDKEQHTQNNTTNCMMCFLQMVNLTICGNEEIVFGVLSISMCELVMLKINHTQVYLDIWMRLNEATEKNNIWMHFFFLQKTKLQIYTFDKCL